MRDNLPAPSDPYPGYDPDLDLVDTYPPRSDDAPLALLTGIFLFGLSLLSALLLIAMRLSKIVAAALLVCLLPALASAQPDRATAACPTVQPAPSWVCVNGGGWLPPELAPRQEPRPVPPSLNPGTPDQPLPPNPDGFKVGKTYRRTATGALVFIVSIGQAKNGLYVTTAECLTESVQDHCWYPGAARLLLSNTNTKGWTLEEER